MFGRLLYSVRSRLVLALLIPLLPLVLLMSYMTLQGNDEQVQRANESAQNYALIASGYQKEVILDLKQLLDVAVEAPDYRTGGPGCQRSLNRISARLGNYSSIGVTDADGKVICSTGNIPAANLSGESYFAQARKTQKFVVSELIPQVQDGKTIVVGAMPWAEADGEFGGLVMASIESSVFAVSFSKIPLPSGSRYYVLDRKNQPVAASGDLSSELSAHLLQYPIVNDTQAPFVIHEDHSTRTYTGVSVANGALTVLIGIPHRYFLSFNTRSLLIGILGPLAILVGSTGLIWYLGNRLVTAPVVALIRAARAYSRGNLTVRPISTGAGELFELSSTFSDMATRIERREHELQEAIQKRELMLREIHHRVKNNLQIVISLVNLQSKSVAIPAAQSAFTEIQTRMRALALVHRYLYESDDLQSVNIGAFLTELCSSLQSAYGVPQSRVAMQIKSDAVFEIIDRAVPLALFMTETISNALRHAFPENRPGYIKVTLKLLDNSQAVFTVEDNGIGIGTESEAGKEDGIYRAPKSMAGLGMSLARAFAKQVDGELSITGTGGTLVTLVFKSKPAPVIDPVAA